MDRKILGQAGEDLAAAVLKTRGYEIIARNYITKAGEIDIIAFKDGVRTDVNAAIREYKAKKK